MSRLLTHFPLRKLDRDVPTKQFLAPEMSRPEWSASYRFDFLYRFYDRDLQPLYFGITAGFPSRWDQHRKRSEWWPLAKHVAVSYYPTNDAVRAAEKAAIRHEKPRFNKQFARWPASVQLRLDRTALTAASQLFREAPPEFIAELADFLTQPDRFQKPEPPPPARLADGST